MIPPLNHGKVLIPAGIAGLAILGVVLPTRSAAAASSTTAACVRVPQTIPNDRLLTSGTDLTVPPGATVFVVLVEAEMYTSQPGFPWMTPSSSKPAVLARVSIADRETFRRCR